MTRGNLIRSFIALAVVLVLAIGGIWRPKTISSPSTGGETMGTGYSVKIAEKVGEEMLTEIAARIDETLLEVNRQMSTWDPESEISRFNHSGSIERFACAAEFAAVTRSALELSAATEGAFDPTLQPLLNLWGFGSEAEEERVPSDEEIAAIRQLTGADKLDAGDAWIQKSEPEVSLALGAIAKGYGVDALAAVLEEFELENWFVEIGGEIAVRGMNPEGDPWRLGVQKPTTNPFDTEYLGVAHLTEGAMATSGDYRNYIKEDGVVYSHILDPRTGRAVKSDLASVSVIAPTCAEADGIATALFVMGAVDGVQWANERPGVEAMFLIRKGEDDFLEIFSSGFKEITGYSAPNSVKKGNSHAWIVVVGCLFGILVVFWLWRRYRVGG